MKKCPYCGMLQPDDGKKCANCGKNISKVRPNPFRTEAATESLDEIAAASAAGAGGARVINKKSRKPLIIGISVFAAACIIVAILASWKSGLFGGQSDTATGIDSIVSSDESSTDAALAQDGTEAEEETADEKTIDLANDPAAEDGTEGVTDVAEETDEETADDKELTEGDTTETTEPNGNTEEDDTAKKKEETKKEEIKKTYDGETITTDYVLSKSNSSYISKSDIKNFSKAKLCLARNEIYARRGLIFGDKDLKSYFESCSWYKGTVSSGKFNTSVFNKYESANLKTIIDYEVEKGYRKAKDDTDEDKDTDDNKDTKKKTGKNYDGITITTDYVIADSNTRYLENSDLKKLSAKERKLARNEIYARHGYIFEDDALQSYFESCSWYKGTTKKADFSDSVFNEYEKANLTFIKNYGK